MSINKLLEMSVGNGACPTAGSGVHQHLLRSALKLVNRIDRDRLVEYLEYATAGCGRDVPDDEIRGVIEWALQVSGSESTFSTRGAERSPRIGNPQPDPKLISSICARPLAYLGELPPLVGLKEYPSELADQVFQTLFERYSPNPLVTFGNTIEVFRVGVLSEARRMFLDHAQFILPNPVIGISGRTANRRRRSPRATSNVVGWINCVVEFDDAPLQDQLRLIEYLAEQAPLLLVVFSENKSFHSWFDVAEFSESERIEFQQLACRLGADPALFRLSQPTRVPLGIRVSEEGVYAPSRHRILHFQPKKG
jgi:hypothetical protein